MKTRFKIWILFFGILVALLCVLTTINQPQEYSDLGKLQIKIERPGILAFQSHSTKGED